MEVINQFILWVANILIWFFAVVLFVSTLVLIGQALQIVVHIVRLHLEDARERRQGKL